MVIYRPHAGTLEQAMKGKAEFSDFDEMKNYIVSQWTESCFGKAPFSVDDIVIEEDSFSDPRIGWHDVRHICISRFGNQDYIAMYGAPQCIGWCATNYDK